MSATLYGIEQRKTGEMGWIAEVRQAASQRLNLEGILSISSLAVGRSDPRLALPHLSVRDIQFIDWAYLRTRGFRGVVFDKDNTLSVPFRLSPSPPIAESLNRCKTVFGEENIAVFSNSAGLSQYDPDGSKATALERSLGIHVLRHGTKKPAGTAEDIEKYFGCPTSLLVMVGDRYFTDIVYGNRHGFLTILTEPISLSKEPFVVRQVRKLEDYLVSSWKQRGFKPPPHALLADGAERCTTTGDVCN